MPYFFNIHQCRVPTATALLPVLCAFVCVYMHACVCVCVCACVCMSMFVCKKTEEIKHLFCKINSFSIVPVYNIEVTDRAKRGVCRLDFAGT